MEPRLCYGMTRARISWIGHLLFIAVFGAAFFYYMNGFNRSKIFAAQAREDREVVLQFLTLPEVPWPSAVSESWTVKSTSRFEDAPIRIVEYGDPLCIDCQAMFKQMQKLEKEFAGKINVAYQFFPLEAACNTVVEKNKHPGACDLSYMLAADSAKFRALHDEIYSNMIRAKTPEFRAALAKKYQLEYALADTAIQNRVKRIIDTGAEYEKTSAKYAHGIRSTPTLIINNRMLIGTLPLPKLRAIFQALIDAEKGQRARFMENWIEPGCAVENDLQCGAK